MVRKESNFSHDTERVCDLALPDGSCYRRANLPNPQAVSTLHFTNESNLPSGDATVGSASAASTIAPSVEFGGEARAKRTTVEPPLVANSTHARSVSSLLVG